MQIQIWKVLVGITALLILFGIGVGILGFDPIAVVIALIGIIIGLTIGFKISPS